MPITLFPVILTLRLYYFLYCSLSYLSQSQYLRQLYTSVHDLYCERYPTVRLFRHDPYWLRIVRHPASSVFLILTSLSLNPICCPQTDSGTVESLCLEPASLTPEPSLYPFPSALH